MDVTVYSGAAEGVVSAPSCTIEAQQALILAAITKTGVRGSGNSDVTKKLLNALTELGARYRIEDDVILFYESPKSCKGVISCSEDTSALLLPLCAVLGGEYTFLGYFDSSFAEAMAKTGVQCTVSSTGLKLKGKINKDEIELVCDDLLAGFVLVLPLIENMKLVYSRKRNGVDFTLQILKSFGFSVSERDGYKLRSYNKEPDFVYNVGGDYGEAVYLMLPGFAAGEVGITGLLSDSLQPKRIVIEELKGYKLNVQELYGAAFVKKSRMKAEVIDISQSIEPSAVLLLSCLGKGRCVIKNASLLKANIKEEFEAVLNGLKNIGADVMQIGDDVFVDGKSKLFGGTADAKESRHISLVFAAAALVSEAGVRIQNCADISELRMLGIFL